MFYGRQFATVDDLEQLLHKHIRYYNEQRIKPSLKNLSPCNIGSNI
ncbi:IS3 family transposase [Pasteurella multocida]|nr:IS3 family transposase [Pasteurella multocida]HDR1053238.1 IS3 family transposase [Pasteurella multocida]HDR1122162.1 IS3 family transposase [Pasteurella multocida]HDR1127923.1 IS3 family transposase [Pasteurella multocida]HDR1132231.1 IS3 family transposase [Pasteurella multocida]